MKKINIYSGITPKVLPKELKSLKPIIKKYLELNIHFSNKWTKEYSEPDAPWWYNERANVSVFAGAVWKNRGEVLEEYSITKKKNSKKNKTYTGRNDLFFEVNRNKFFVEAKCEDFKPIKKIKKTIENTSKEAKNIILSKEDEVDGKKLAMIFSYPFFLMKDYRTKTGEFKESKIKDELKKWLCSAMKMNSIVGWACNNDLSKINDKKYYCPGAVIFIKHIK